MINPKTKRFSLVKNVEEDFFLATATNVKTNFKFQATDFADVTDGKYQPLISQIAQIKYF